MNRAQTVVPRTRRVLACAGVVMSGLLTLSACGSDSNDSNQDPVTPANSGFGTVAPVDNSVAGGDTPVDPGTDSVPAGGTVAGTTP